MCPCWLITQCLHVYFPCHAPIARINAAKATLWTGLHWVLCLFLLSGWTVIWPRTGDSSPTLSEGRQGTFNVQQLMIADGTPSFSSIRVMTRPALKILG